MKKNLIYDVLEDCMDMNDAGQMQYREQVVVFRKGEINHYFTITIFTLFYLNVACLLQNRN